MDRARRSWYQIAMALRVASLKGLKVSRAVQVAAAAIYRWRSYAARGAFRWRPEEIVHIAIMNYLRVTLDADCVAVHIPSEAKRTGANWAVLQALGYINGMSDIWILYRGTVAFIEVKADNGALSPDQEAFLEWTRARGYHGIVARSVDDVAAFLTQIGLKP